MTLFNRQKFSMVRLGGDFSNPRPMGANMFKKIAISISLVFALLFILVAIMFMPEKSESNFSSYTEAKASGLMDRGWIPDFIPKSSWSIKEQHYIDTNQV